jgi:DNA-binding NarL/FixJ family response regulator
MTRRLIFPGRKWRQVNWGLVRTVAGYGLALGVGVAVLQWLEYRRLAQAHSGEIYIVLVAAGFMALGVWVGARLFRRPAAAPGFERNVQAVASLGISEREFEVLEQLAAGRSNKEIAGRLNVSPNTVKTHVARLYEKLEARRRTDAVNRARELGMIP